METIELEKRTHLSIATICDSLLSYCQSNDYSLAIWRLPFSDEIHFLVSFQALSLNKVEIENLKPGFIIAEFEKGIKGENYFLSSDFYFKSKSKTDEIPMEEFQERLPNFRFVEMQKNNSALQKPPISEPNDYTQLVAKAIEEIKSGAFKKVVLARKKEILLPDSFSGGILFEKINEKYLNTFNSFISTPIHGNWVGASPETLVSRNSEEIFKTVALAGTQKAGEKSEKEANWSQKEIEEQAYVSRYILEKFNQIRLREYEDVGPKTVRIGNLFHLKTNFSVNLNEVNFPNLLSTMLQLLHPTSAVCGMPKEEAINFVLKNEASKRELYSGYCGPVNIENETFIFVNLRCAKISDFITFFAGAGITEDSVPEKEFQETELKMESLISLF